MAEKEKKTGKPSAQEIAARKAAKKKADTQVEDAGVEESSTPAPPPRLIEHYKTKVVPALQQKFGYTNLMAVPRLEKIVISMGLGKFATAGGEGKSQFEKAEKELTVIAGQKPVRCKAKKSVANFKVREGQETGLKVTLRGNRMYEFLDRLITLAFPRVKDFRGVNPDGFDKTGNYNFGFNEQTVFPEVDGATVTFQQGMNITMVTTARGNIEAGRELLKQFGFPFRETAKQDR
ncbi:MAG TPA: 50S ribosomal protein L5 [Tepidisphaeraceae bacterium]|nr:50S ribosomal protein L5 [Tepidisphaeraceae bacterium]